MFFAVAWMAGACSETRHVELAMPMADNVVGKWVIVHGFEHKGGEWVEVADYDAIGSSFTFYKGGRAVSSYTDNDGQTYLRETQWQVDDETGVFTINGYPTQLMLLRKDTMELGYNDRRRKGGEAGIEYKDCWKRVPMKTVTLAEKLVGKWKFAGSYEMKNGSWHKTRVGVPDEATTVFGEDGDLHTYVKAGGKELRAEYLWSVNNRTGELCCFREDRTVTVTASMVNANTMQLRYTKNYDPADGTRMTHGEFRDVFVREK